MLVLIVGTLPYRGLPYAATPQTAPARCVSKRTHVWGGSGESSASTRYFAIFEMADGTRQELGLSGREFRDAVRG